MVAKELDKLGQSIFDSRYSYPGESGFSDRCRSVAKHVAACEKEDDREKIQDKFNKALASGDFVPGGRIYFGAGRSRPQLLNCYFILPEDNTDSIGKTIQDMYKISCMGGGIGFNFSKIRPKGDDVSNIKNSAPGSVSVMKMINEIANHVKSGGGRRAALMAELNVDHPDLIEFLHVKLDLAQLNNFNISVAITDEFIEACENDQAWSFKFNNRDYHVYQMDRVSKSGRETINVVALNEADALSRAEMNNRIDWSETFENVQRVELKALELWNKIWVNAVETGDPGIFNISLANRYTNCSYFLKLWGTNPCGEIVLESYANCCLGHINLSNMVLPDGSDIDWQRLARTIRVGVRFLDNVLTVNDYPIPECKTASNRTRRVGLGTLGLHHALLKLGIKYGSDKCLEFLDRLYATIRDESYLASMYIAREKGSFPEFDSKKFLAEEFARTLPARIRMLIKENGIRNCFLLTAAPTGCQAGSTLVNTSDGILRLDELIKSNGDSKYYEIDTTVCSDIGKPRRSEFGFVNGVAKTKKIRLDSGLTLESTFNHQYRIIDNTTNYAWCRADELQEGDILVSRLGGYEKEKEPTLVRVGIKESDGRLNGILQPSIMNPNLAKLVGLMYGDGSIHKRSIRIHCNSNYNNQIHDIVELIEKVFGIVPKINKDNRENCVSININSVTVLEFLTINNLLKPKSHEVSIPRLIRESSKESLNAFIEGYFMADGCFTKNGMYQIDTVSQEMAQQLVICLRSLGRNARITEYTNVNGSKGKRTKYRVREVKTGTSNEILRYIPKCDSDIQEICNSIGGNLTFDRVAFIEDSECMTYDIEVPETKTYIANSIVSHNTVSMVHGTSTGIEPIFAAMYKRRWREGNAFREQLVLDPMFKQALISGEDVTKFVGAYDVTPEEHMAVQATIQRYIDNAISKTINLPEDANKDPEKIAKMALKFAPYLKGLTIYRAGSKGTVDAPEPLQAVPLTPENIQIARDLIAQEQSVEAAAPVVCTIGGECGG